MIDSVGSVFIDTKWSARGQRFPQFIHQRGTNCGQGSSSARLGQRVVPVTDRSLGMGRPAWSMRRRWLHQLFHAVNTLSEGSRRAPGLPLRKSSLVRSVPDSDDLAVVAGVLNWVRLF